MLSERHEGQPHNLNNYAERSLAIIAGNRRLLALLFRTALVGLSSHNAGPQIFVPEVVSRDSCPTGFTQQVHRPRGLDSILNKGAVQL